MLDQRCKKIFESHDLLAMSLFIEQLIKDGKQDDVDTYKKTPLMYACNYGNFALVNILLDAGVDVNKVSINGDAAVTYAIYNRNRNEGAKIIATLLKNGADVDEYINKKSEYPLLVAAKFDNAQCFKILLPYSTWCYHDVDKDGYSAILYASQNSCKPELDRFLFYAKIKERSKSLGLLLLRFINLPFKFLRSASVYFLKKTGVLDPDPVSILKNSNVPSDAIVKFNDDALQQYDSEFEAFAQDIKNHVELTLLKSKSVVAQLEANLKKSEDLVAQLENASNEHNTVVEQFKDAVTQQEIAKSAYVANSRILEALSIYKERFDSYKFFDNSHSYSKTNFFETSRKYIKDITPVLFSLDSAFNLIELSKNTTVNLISKPNVLKFSQSLKPETTVSDIESLGKKLNELSLKKMKLD